ncbi:MAG: TM2 domain-containing protein [Saprospiraceae bacterium]|nr:TM2 domain-containing protein [Saprospiraceae bacterium]
MQVPKGIKEIVYVLTLGLILLSLVSLVVYETPPAETKKNKKVKKIRKPDLSNSDQLAIYLYKQQKIKEKRQRKRPKSPKYDYGERSQLTAFWLCLFLGIVAAHRIYLGHYGWAALQLLTLGGCFVWVIVDLVFISLNLLKDRKGRKPIPW